VKLVGVNGASELTAQHLVEHHGQGLYTLYNSSISNVISSLSDDAPPIPLPADPEDLLNISQPPTPSNLGAPLFTIMKGKRVQIGKIPKTIVDKTSGVNAPRNYWASMVNQRAYADQLGRKLGYPPGDWAQWYNVRDPLNLLRRKLSEIMLFFY